MGGIQHELADRDLHCTLLPHPGHTARLDDPLSPAFCPGLAKSAID